MDKNAEALDEADVMANAFPIMRGQSDIPSGIKRTFGNLAVPMDGTLVDAQPDFYYGARPDQLDSRVQEKLNSYIVPSVNDRAPVLRNNFTKGKGPGGTWAVAGRQARYDGALGARGMQQLQSDGQPEPDYDSNADTITSTFDGEHLHIYTTHPTAPTNLEGKPESHMNQLNGWTMTGNPRHVSPRSNCVSKCERLGKRGKRRVHRRGHQEGCQPTSRYIIWIVRLQ